MTVYVNAVMYFRVADAESAVNNVDDYAESAKLIASTTLRNVLGTKTLGKILSGEKDFIHQTTFNKLKKRNNIIVAVNHNSGGLIVPALFQTAIFPCKKGSWGTKNRDFVLG